MTDSEKIKHLIRQAVEEDLGNGDHTSLSTIPAETNRKANLLIKESGILCGVDIARMVFETIDQGLEFKALMHDGEKINPGDIVFEVEGNAISILSAERLALNFMQRMSGIATQTNQLTQLISDLPCKLLDTRKTTPNMRIFEKMAVKTGGGHNHRFGLFDMILIKNNHVDFAGGVAAAITKARDYIRKNELNMAIEIEVRNFEELEEAIATGGFQRIMLDNFSPENLQHAIQIIAGRFETEASGGITAESLRAYAATGVDFISVGALTHQVKSLDMSLRALK
jgi:nicotinate-nucleotide pyrophosphorylase (carboxylating)